MTPETRNTIIGLIAVAVVALIVGIWVNLEKNIAELEIDEMTSEQMMTSDQEVMEENGDTMMNTEITSDQIMIDSTEVVDEAMIQTNG